MAGQQRRADVAAFDGLYRLKLCGGRPGNRSGNQYAGENACPPVPSRSFLRSHGSLLLLFRLV
jgi:hypothetical protein